MEKRYFDLSFHGTEAIYSEGFTPDYEVEWTAPYWADGSVYWKSWREYLPNNRLFSFEADGTDPEWRNAN